MSLDRHFAIEQAYKAYENGQLGEATERCEKLLQANKNDVQAIRLAALIAIATSDLEAAISKLKMCVSRLPKEPVFQCDLGRTLTLAGRFEAAIPYFDKALKLLPNYIEAIAGKADALEHKGEFDAARAFIEPYVQNGVIDDGLAVVMMRLMQREKKFEDAANLANELLAKPARDQVSRRLLNLELGRVCDKLARHEEAFAAFARANASGSLPFDEQAYVQSTDRLIGMFSKENLAVLPRAGNRSDVPIFIACMPRSGSTLVEQIIYAHPRAYGIGEHNQINALVEQLQPLIESFQEYPACIADLKRPQLDRFAEEYLTLCKRRSGGAIRVANKHILNYRHLGMIALLFPKARIVHIRRNRIDNALACFMAALTPSQFPWISDLTRIGLVWREYERLMAHWRSTLDLPMLEIRYEDLVENTEEQIRRLIEFCGLEWDDRCLRYYEVDRKVMTLSYDQVRQPIFKTAVMRYKKYEPFLGPLIEALGDEPS